MKKINILGIIAIIVYIVSFIGSFSEFKEGASAGWNHDTHMRSDSIYQNPIKIADEPIEVRKIDNTNRAKVENKHFYMEVPYEISSITTYVETSTWHSILTLSMLPLIFAIIYGFYSLIRFLISVSNNQVFTDKNVHRIRWFVYSAITTQLILVLMEWLREQAAIAQINLPGYEIISNALTNFDWISMIVTILLTEIFAIGTKIKEEQDLTI